MRGRGLLFAMLLLARPGSGWAQDSDHDVAKQLNNPVASLTTVPLQFNYDCCYGARNADRVTLNIQPVMPFALDDDLDLIVRTILPEIAQQGVAPGQGASFGFGDTTQSFFLSPKSEGFTWALGPAFFWPTATAPALGSHKWGAGPTGLILKQQEGWTIGMLANHIWSYGGEGEYPNVSNTLLQPFLSHTWPDTTSLSLNTETTYNWTARQWTVPINLALAHLVRLGGQRVNLQGGVRYYADAPPDNAGWGLRFTTTFIFGK
jgi:hypothetical protein